MSIPVVYYDCYVLQHLIQKNYFNITISFIHNLSLLFYNTQIQWNGCNIQSIRTRLMKVLHLHLSVWFEVVELY